MRSTTLVRASAALALLFGSAIAAEPIKSGPQPGDDVPGPFHVLNLSGPAAGEKNCQV